MASDVLVYTERETAELTSKPRTGVEVPGVPWFELVRDKGGVRMRRPNLSKVVGDTVRDMTSEVEPTRWCCVGRAWSVGLLVEAAACADVSDVGAGERVLFASTTANAAFASCCEW
jgi:hypothetical protein